ncbi:hypothetical protein AB0K60_06675 [Thermopolyspora sp. NPDC052614]
MRLDVGRRGTGGVRHGTGGTPRGYRDANDADIDVSGSCGGPGQG